MNINPETDRLASFSVYHLLRFLADYSGLLVAAVAAVGLLSLNAWLLKHAAFKAGEGRLAYFCALAHYINFFFAVQLTMITTALVILGAGGII